MGVTKEQDLDALNRPVREAAQRWARAQGKGWSQCYEKNTQWWHLILDGMDLWVDVNGVAHIDGEPGEARSARGMTMLLNKVARARTK